MNLIKTYCKAGMCGHIFLFSKLIFSSACILQFTFVKYHIPVCNFFHVGSSTMNNGRLLAYSETPLPYLGGNKWEPFWYPTSSRSTDSLQFTLGNIRLGNMTPVLSSLTLLS